MWIYIVIAAIVTMTIVVGLVSSWSRAIWIVLASLGVLAAYQLAVISSLLAEYDRNVQVVQRDDTPACDVPSTVLKAYALVVSPMLTHVIQADHDVLAEVKGWMDGAVTDVVRVTTPSGKVGGLQARFAAIEAIMIRNDTSGVALASDIASGACRYILCGGHAFLAAVPPLAWSGRIEAALRSSRSHVLRGAADSFRMVAMARLHRSNILGLPDGAKLADYGAMTLATSADSVVNRTFTQVLPKAAVQGGETAVTLLGYGLLSSP